MTDDNPQRSSADARSVILVVDDDETSRRVLSRLLSREGFEVLTAADGSLGLEVLRTQSVDFVFTDIHMPNLDGLGLLKEIKSLAPEIPVLVMTGFGTIETAIEALREGAYDYVKKPIEPKYLLHRLKNALEHSMMRREIRRLRELMDRDESSRLLGEGEAMRQLRDVIARVARNDITVLIEGETGTGKEVVSREIHRRSRRSERPFVAINCGAISHELLESELFGHVKGAFTGATSSKEGLLTAAEGGTVLLDEIGEMSPELQVKLLRVLEERQVLPVGSTRSHPIDVRVLAATHRDLQEMVDDKTFRQDLYFRLNIVPIEVPPLRQRREDIPMLAHYFLDQCRETYQTQATSFDTLALQHLVSHEWPGNVRELRNVVTRAAAMNPVDVVTVECLPAAISGRRLVTHDLEEAFLTLEEMEKRYIARVLERTEGNKSDAAALLGIDRSTLYRKCKTYGF